MAVKGKASAGHLFARLLGMTGLLVAAGGALVWYVYRSAQPDLAEQALYVVWGGLAAAGIWILAEIPAFFMQMSSRRGAVGSSVFVQIALALALFAGINAFAFVHYKRIDLTWDRAFTLKPEIRDQLANLRGETDIVVVQRNLTSGLGGDTKPDRYDIAASKKIIEKVRELAEQFTDLGPRFRVQVLDIQDDDFEKRVTAIRDAEIEAAKAKGEPPASPLADAINDTAENAIFFKAGNEVQRLAFHDIYQTDKAASDKAGNLVLAFQGVEPFARKILNIEEKKPRVVTAVVHPALSMTSRDHALLTMSGAKQALERHGILASDILLRKQEGDGGLSQEAAAETFDENRFEQVEDLLSSTEKDLAEFETAYDQSKKSLAIWKNQSLDELNKTYVYVQLGNQEGVVPRTALAELDRRKVPYKAIPVDEDDRKMHISSYQRDVSMLERALEEGRKERDALIKERATLNVDELAEKKRIADVESKMKRMLAGADLLIIPRFTFLDLPSGAMIPNKVHKLDDAQLRSIKAFLKEGKPVLFLLGPSNEKRDIPDFGGGDDDGLEPMLADLGVRLPKQTILYNIEVKEFTERKRTIGFSKKELTLPPVTLDWEPGVNQVSKKKSTSPEKNAIRVSLNVLAKSLGDKLAKELQIRHPRPVYVEADADSKGVFDEAAVFLMTSPDTWNENSPFLNEKREAPRFTPTKDGDKSKGTLEEVRRGPFPIAVAVEKKLPESWFGEGESPRKARIGVIGNGGVFVGATLNPVKEKLLLDVVNWLLGRDDLLATSTETWEFPRVAMTPAQRELWHWGTFLGLPAIFLYLGVMVWFVRRMR
jgi:hypothetical protein